MLWEATVTTEKKEVIILHQLMSPKKINQAASSFSASSSSHRNIGGQHLNLQRCMWRCRLVSTSQTGCLKRYKPAC